MNFLFACGGTAGHINPAVGVAGRIRELLPDSEILFVGAEGKMETELVPREGYEIRTIPMSNLSRSLSIEGLRHNISSLKGLLASAGECKRILKEFRPDVVVGTGGYVCYPVLSTASRMGIPTAVHESNAQPGLTTKMLEKHVDRIMVGFEEARANYKDPSKVVVTGTPVRLDFMRSDKLSARRALGLDPEEPLVVSVWGSLGATEMNKTVGEMISLAMDEKPFHLIHSAGKRGIESMTRHLREVLGVSGWDEAGFEVKDYLYNMALLMAAADVVLCRSGASTLAELAAMGKPAVLVPSPNVVNNHQEKNARVLERAGAVKVLLEQDATAQNMLDTLKDLLAHPGQLDTMSECMRSMSVENATDEITSIVLSLAAK